MFESAELGHSIDDETYRREEPKLREALLDVQFDVLEAERFPVILLVGGVDGAGKGETVNALLSWMDAHHVQVHALDTPTTEEATRPRMWRFWRDLPPKGRMGIFLGSWYTEPITERAYGRMKKGAFEEHLSEIRGFERLLTDSGALLVKVWMHLSKDRQRKRLKKLARDKDTRWRVTPQEWANFKRVDKFRRFSEHALRETSTGAAPWLVVEGTDPNYRSLTVGHELLQAMRKRLERDQAQATSRGDRRAPRVTEPGATPATDKVNQLTALDLSQALKKPRYEEQLSKLQQRLNLLTRHKHFGEISVVAAFEGADAAGKGGSIRRITEALDARYYRVIPIAAPTEEERAQPYLWRFWRRLPRRGHFAIYDRSWYGRVLVERVEGFASPPEWQRAYAEINSFEAQLREANTVVSKFWLQIDQEEQLKRFKERERIGFKRYKITEEDWRNRKKWAAYQVAACEMLDRTSTVEAPWTLVESNDKYYARIKVLKTLVEHIESALESL
jgi:polyphosphate:AMP phosphotransferase